MIVYLWRWRIFTHVHLGVSCCISKVWIHHHILRRISRVKVWYFPQSMASFLQINILHYIILQCLLRSTSNLLSWFYDCCGSLPQGSFSFNLYNYEINSYYNCHCSNARRNCYIDSKHFVFNAFTIFSSTFKLGLWTGLLCNLWNRDYLYFIFREIITEILKDKRGHDYNNCIFFSLIFCLCSGVRWLNWGWLIFWCNWCFNWLIKLLISWNCWLGLVCQLNIWLWLSLILSCRRRHLTRWCYLCWITTLNGSACNLRGLWRWRDSLILKFYQPTQNRVQFVICLIHSLIVALNWECFWSITCVRWLRAINLITCCLIT